MKSAILIVGGERNLTRTIEHLKQNLLEPNRPVLFFACETDNPERLLGYFDGFEIGGSLLLPTFRNSEYAHIQSMCLERPAFSQQVFERAMRADGNCWSKDYVIHSGTILQYYQLWKAWCLLLEYERKNQMKFDFCVKWRLDALITRPLVFADIPVSGTEDDLRCMGNTYMLDNLRRFNEDRHYEHAYGHEIQDNIVWSFGPEQVFMAKRKNFQILGNMIFYDGLWDPGNSFAFSSESFFHEFCNRNQLLHWEFIESENCMQTTSADTLYMVTLLR